MADISKCPGTGCDKKDTCYRYTSKAGIWQSYFGTPPINNGRCEFYYPNEITINAKNI